MPGRRYAPCQHEASGTLLRAVGVAARGSDMSCICRKGVGLGRGLAEALHRHGLVLGCIA